MTLRFVSPMLGLFTVPTIVGIVAVTQLVSLDGWAQKQTGRSIAAQPQNASQPLAQSLVDGESPATTIAIQTAQERYNTTLSQIQAGDWLTQQGQFQAAKAAYRQALSQTQNADLASTATDRLNQLSRQLALKPVAKSVAKAIVKPVVKTASKSVVKLAANPITKPGNKIALSPVVRPESNPNVGSDVKPSVQSVVKLDNTTARGSSLQSSTRPIVDPIANSFDHPIANPTASDRLLIPQPTEPDAPQLGQSFSPETPLPAQTIVAESHQWGPEPPAPLN